MHDNSSDRRRLELDAVSRICESNNVAQPVATDRLLPQIHRATTALDDPRGTRRY
jgi:hypothetical protein